ncbi:MAG: hypothetical protein WCE28_15495 [Bradyrhizobium sp.]|jgi:hypothetical protein
MKSRRHDGDVRFVPTGDIAMLFNHLVGSNEQGGRNGKTKWFRGPEVDNELKFGRLLDR